MAEDTYRLILPISPYTLLDPNKRWVPREGTEPAEVTKLIPPLVHKLRRCVYRGGGRSTMREQVRLPRHY